MKNRFRPVRDAVLTGGIIGLLYLISDYLAGLWGTGAVQIGAPLKAIPQENWTPHTECFLIVVTFFVWGFYYLWTFRDSPETRERSSTWKHLRNATTTAQTIIAFSIGLLGALTLFGQAHLLVPKTTNGWVGTLILSAAISVIEGVVWLGRCGHDAKWQKYNWISPLAVGLLLIFGSVASYVELIPVKQERSVQFVRSNVDH
jgi:heme/copper-type cytochrome/quinol oxidase subunit 2